MFETSLDLVNASAVALITAFIYGAVIRAIPMSMLINFGLGVLFGIGGVIAMLSPVEFYEGLTIDVRAIFVAMSAAFLGWRGGLVTLAIVCVARTTLVPMPPQGWSLMMWIYLSLVGHYAAALVWRQMRHRLEDRVILSAAVLVFLTQVSALILTAWDEILHVPNIWRSVAMLYAARCIALFLSTTVMLREEHFLKNDEKHREQALRDPLTGLLNRRGLQRKLDGMDNNRSLSVICMDLDRFKELNDREGHIVGDAVLEAAGIGFRHVMPTNGYVCRLGGDEFIAVAWDVAPDELEQLAKDFLEVLPSMAGGVTLRTKVTTSVGYASSDSAEVDFTTLAGRADAALYRAKAAGGNCAVGDRIASERPVPKLRRVRHGSFPQMQ